MRGDVSGLQACPDSVLVSKYLFDIYRHCLDFPQNSEPCSYLLLSAQREEVVEKKKKTLNLQSSWKISAADTGLEVERV